MELHQKVLRRAVTEELIGAAVGLLTLALGIFLLNTQATTTYWPLLLIFLGPVILFVSFMGGGTYLENADEDHYFPDPFRREETTRRKGERHYAPGAWNP